MTQGYTVFLALALVAGSPPGRLKGPEFMVATWYDRADPIGSFRSRVYDLRRGQFDAVKVGGWLATMARDHPRYVAAVRPVDLDATPRLSEDDALRAARARVLRPFIDAALAQLAGPMAPAPASTLPDPIPRGSPAGSRSFLQGTSPVTPFVSPFGRPHP